jgi:membrane-bound ClpP family serine protease
MGGHGYLHESARHTDGIFRKRQQSEHTRGQQYEALDPQPRKDFAMTTILIIILILLLIGGLPVFPHSRSWGYGPSGIVGVVLVILLVLLLLGMI